MTVVAFNSRQQPQIGYEYSYMSAWSAGVGWIGGLGWGGGGGGVVIDV